MTIRQKLESYQSVHNEYLDLRQRYDDLNAEVINKNGAINTDGLPHGSNISDPTLNAATVLSDNWRNVIKKLVEDGNLWIECRDMIYSKNEDGSYVLSILEQKTLAKKYIDLEFLPLWEIAEQLEVSTKTCERYHREALKKLEVRYGNEV